jgi:hypothetical protein
MDLFEQLLHERDQILSSIMPPPETEERHADIAVFAGWADGVLTDEFLTSYLKKFHADLSECRTCSANYAYFEARRTERLAHITNLST